MKKAIVIFAGIRFPHYLANQAIDWSARNGASLEGLFLRASKEKEEGYLFPSDLDEAEQLSNSKDAERDDLRILRDYEQLLKHLGKEKNVRVHAKILTGPSFQEIQEATKGVDIVFADASYDPSDVLVPAHFNLEELKKSSHAPVELVSEKLNKTS